MERVLLLSGQQAGQDCVGEDQIRSSAGGIVVVSVVRLSDQKEAEPGRRKLWGNLIAAFQCLQRDYQEKTEAGSSQQRMVGR